MTKKCQRKTPESCPECGSLDIIPIVYGYPGEEMIDAAKRGEITLGGCVIGDRDPQKQCNACGAQFDLQPVRASGRAQPKK